MTGDIHRVSTLLYTAPSGKVIEFDPDWTEWPKGIEEPVQQLSYADKLVLEALCYDLIHALHIGEG